MAEGLTIASEAATLRMQRTSIMAQQAIFERVDLEMGLRRDLLHRILDLMGHPLIDLPILEHPKDSGDGQEVQITDHPKDSGDSQETQMGSTGSAAAIRRKVSQERVGVEADQVVVGMRRRASEVERALAAGAPTAGDTQVVTEVALNTTAR
jgi:hypothetical protein